MPRTQVRFERPRRDSARTLHQASSAGRRAVRDRAGDAGGGYRVPGHPNRNFAILSVIGFIVMFGGVVFAITGPRVAGGKDRTPRTWDSSGKSARRGPAARSPVAWRTGSASVSTNRPVPTRGNPHRATPFLCLRRWSPARWAPPQLPTSSFLPSSWGFRVLGASSVRRGQSIPRELPAEWGPREKFCCQMECCGGLWGKVADNGATGAPEWQEVAGCFSAPTHRSSTTRGG